MRLHVEAASIREVRDNAEENAMWRKRGFATMSLVFLSASCLSVFPTSSWSDASYNSDVDELANFGEYLSAQCAGCHLDDSCESGIPPLSQLPPDYFVLSMERFGRGFRDNAAMRSVVKSLEQHEIQALAVYYSKLTQPEC